MTGADGILDPWPDEGDRASEGSLRPRKLEEFIGQARAREQLGIVLESARRRGLPPDAGSSSTEELLRLALRGLGSQR